MAVVDDGIGLISPAPPAHPTATCRRVSPRVVTVRIKYVVAPETPSNRANLPPPLMSPDDAPPSWRASGSRRDPRSGDAVAGRPAAGHRRPRRAD